MSDPQHTDAEPFQGLILSLGAAALAPMSAAAPTGAAPDLEQARQAIDLLEVLQQKTKGNLTEAEAALLDSVLFDVRMRFMEALQRPPAGAAPPSS